MSCTLLLIFQIVFFVLAVVLVIHHYCKYDNLDGCDRCFQPEDVCVCCCDRMDRPFYQRCSHEMYVALSFSLGIACMVMYQDAEC